MGPLSQIDRSTTTSHDAAMTARSVTPVSEVDTGSGSVRVRLREHRETGDASVDQALSSSSQSVMRTVTYSFNEVPAAAATIEQQQSRSSSDRQRVREALNYYATVAQVQFVEVGAGGDLQYAVTAAPSPAEVQKARGAEAQTENESKDERRDAETAVAQQQAAAEAATKVQQSQQTDDLLGLNLPDPDGQGGTPVIG